MEQHILVLSLGAVATACCQESSKSESSVGEEARASAVETALYVCMWKFVKHRGPILGSLYAGFHLGFVLGAPDS